MPNKPGDFNEFIRFDNGYQFSVTAFVEENYPEVSMRLEGAEDFGYVGEELELVLVVENTGKVAIEEFIVQEYFTNVQVDLGKIGLGEVVSQRFPYTVTQKDVDQGNIILNFTGRTEKAYQFNTYKSLYLERVPAISILKISDIAEAIIMENHPYEISIQNIGTEVLTISEINNDVVGLKGYTGLPLEIQPGSITSLMFNFRADQQNDINEKLFIINNSVNEPEVEIPFNVQPKYGPGEWEENITIDKEYFSYEGEELNFSILITNTGDYYNKIEAIEINTGKQLFSKALNSGEYYNHIFSHVVTRNDITNQSILFDIETSDPNGQTKGFSQEIKFRPTSKIAITSDPTFFEELGEEVRFDIAFEHSGGLFIMEAYYLWDIIPVMKVEKGWIINHTITEEDIDRGAVEIRVNVTDEYGFSVQEIYSLPYIPKENGPGDGADSNPENEEDIEEGGEEYKEGDSEENGEEERGDKEGDPINNGDNKEDPADKPNEVNIDHQVFNQSFAPKFYDFAKADQAIVQADGKFVVSGNFIEIDGQEVNGLVRLNPDGTLDTSFKFDFAPITTVRRMEI
ncbi:MAG TPA: delta-60 repeat domain-containing protein, partial [Anditalea sp.]|nr:delta-60 repeat domain-containing protein [Anditalea sp.]